MSVKGRLVSEFAMILVELMPTAVLVALVLWLAFPHAMGVAVLLFVLVGLLVFARRRQGPVRRWC
jgi:hypothetical protein